MLTKAGFYEKINSEKQKAPVETVAKNSTDNKNSKDYSSVVLILAVVVMAFFLGVMRTRVSILETQILAQKEKGGGLPSALNPPLPNNPEVLAAAQPTIAQGQVDKLAASDHVRGNRKARLQLIVYSDLECPFCKKFHPTIGEILDQYEGKVVIAYRHFPLDTIHSQARKEAEATECAAKLGGDEAFWQLTDKIYAVTPSNNGLDLEILPILAAQVGLDKTSFKACLDQGEMAETVDKSFQSGLKAGVNGTPNSFLVDSKTGAVTALAGALPFEQIKPVIDQLLTEN